MKNFNGTILVAGATGRTGLWVVKSLQMHHLDYHIFVRSGAKAIDLFGPEIVDKLTLGTLENPEEIKAAVSHAVAIICAVGGNVTDPASPPPSAIDRDGIIRLATIAKEEGVKRFILVSSLSVTKPEHPLNKYGQVLTMKLEAENEVRRLFSEAGFSYTILRPGGLTEGSPLQHALIFGTGDTITTGSIRRSNLAEVAVLSLFNKNAHNLTFEIIEGKESEQVSIEQFFKYIDNN